MSFQRGIVFCFRDQFKKNTNATRATSLTRFFAVYSQAPGLRLPLANLRNPPPFHFNVIMSHGGSRAFSNGLGNDRRFLLGPPLSHYFYTAACSSFIRSDSAEPNTTSANGLYTITESIAENGCKQIMVKGGLEKCANIPNACTMCNKPGINHCSTCGSRYCSKKCQEDDWPVHKRLCKIYKRFKQSKRPSPYHNLVVYFPHDSEDPVFSWLHIPSVDKEGNINMEPDGLLGNSRKLRPVQKLKANFLLLRLLPYELQYAISTDQPKDSGNKSLGSIDEDLSYLLNESILVTRGTGDGKSNDIDLADVRHFIDHMRCLHAVDRYFYELDEAGNPGEAAAVRVNCLGDRFLHPFRREEFEKVIARTKNSQPITEVPATLGESVELALYALRIQPALTWRDRHVHGDHATDEDSSDPRINTAISDLNLVKEVAINKQDIGSILVVRRDGKDLLPGHLMALCAYGRYLRSKSQAQDSNGASKEGFLDFFEKWRAENPDESLRELVSPYDL